MSDSVFSVDSFSVNYGCNAHCIFFYSVVTDVKCIKVAPGGILPIPLSYVMSHLWVRPIDRSQPPGHGYVFCNKPITWSHVSRPGETVEELRMCISSRVQCFRLVYEIFL